MLVLVFKTGFCLTLESFLSQNLKNQNPGNKNVPRNGKNEILGKEDKISSQNIPFWPTFAVQTGFLPDFGSVSFLEIEKSEFWEQKCSQK